MADGKFDIVRYENIGGINRKVSDHATSTAQFLGMVNLDHAKPGALRSRQGMTQMMTNGTSGTVTSFHEYIKTSGLSEIIVGANTDIFRFVPPTGLTSIPKSILNYSNGSMITGPSFVNNARWSFATVNDQVWAANGNRFLRYDGATFYNASHPLMLAQCLASQTGNIGGSGAFKLHEYSGSTFLVSYAFSFLGKNGHQGPINDWESSSLDALRYHKTLAVPSTGASTITFLIDFSTQGFTNYATQAISGLQIWRGFYGTSLGADPPPRLIDYYLLETMGITTSMAAGFTYVDSQGLTTLILGQLGSYKYSNHFGQFNPAILGAGTDLYFDIYTKAPKYLAKHNDSLFAAGWTGNPNQILPGKIFDPQHIEVDYPLFVDKNDGDGIVGIHPLGNQLVIYKQFSMHRLNGDGNDNYDLKKITGLYGAISHFAVAEANNSLFSLCPQGIVQYDGTAYSLISDEIQEYFDRMNVSAAASHACAVVDKDRKQIKFSFPVDGASTNNFTVVYDYQDSYFTTTEGPAPSSYAFMKGPLDRQNVYQGGYTGMPYFYGPSFWTDNGTGFTCSAFSRFEFATSPNHTKMWRRFYMDVEPVSYGASAPIDITFYKNYDQTTGVTTRSFNMATFHQRADFGIDSKSIAAKMVAQNLSGPVEIKSFGWDFRPLRET